MLLGGGQGQAALRLSQPQSRAAETRQAWGAASACSTRNPGAPMAVVPSGGWHKRSRAGAPTAALSRADVEPRFLCKRSVDLGSHPSPGPFSGNRMVMMPPTARGDGAGTVRAFLASAGGARALDLPLNKDAIGENGRDLHAGKDGNLLPIAVAGALETHALPQVVHRLELQGLALARPRASSAGGALRATLAAVDASGAATVASVADASIPADSTAAVTPQYRTTPPDKCEPGWAGVDICASNNCALGIARQLARAVDIYDKDMHVRTMHTGAYPTAVRYLDEVRRSCACVVASHRACGDGPLIPNLSLSLARSLSRSLARSRANTPIHPSAPRRRTVWR